MKKRNWKKRTVIAGIAFLLLGSGNGPIHLAAEDTASPAPTSAESSAPDAASPLDTQEEPGGEKAFHITYQSSSSDMGSVTSAEETGVVSEDSKTVQYSGSEAVPNSGYQFVNRTAEENGTSVIISEDPKLVPSEISEDMTYIANFAPEATREASGTDADAETESDAGTGDAESNSESPEVSLAASSDASNGGLTISYDPNTGIHSITEQSGNTSNTIILFCMNNELHWPHTTDSIKSVPPYSETTLSEFLGANGVKYSPNLELQLKSLLYAGYPYNGFGQYQIVDSPVKEVTEEEFDALLDAPQYLREDFPNSLGERVFTLKNSAIGSENYSKLGEFLNEVFSYSKNGTRTHSGLTSLQIQNTSFWRAAFCMNFNDPVKAYNSNYVNTYYVTEEQAYSSTQNAVWNLMYEWGLKNNNKVDNSGLTTRLYDSSTQYKLLETVPDEDEISISGDQSFYYNKTDRKWHTNPISLSVPENYNANFTLTLPTGVQEENNQTQFNRTGSFTLVADNPDEISEIILTATIPYMVGDIKVYKPDPIKASGEKGFQNMVGAVIRKSKISRTFQIAKKTSVTVKKVWDDNNNQDGLRPNAESFASKVHLYSGDTEVTGSKPSVTDNGDNTYTVTYSNLPKSSNGTEIKYSVKEDLIDGYTVSVSGNASEGFTIINQHTPAEKTTVTEDHSNSGGDTPAPSAKSADVIDSSPDTADHTDLLMHGITMILSLTAALITVATYRKYQ